MICKRNHKINRNKKGLSLIEIVIAMIIIALMISPIYNLFFIGTRLNQEGKNLYFVNMLCSNYLNAISNYDRSKLVEIEDMEDKEILGHLTLENLKIDPCFDGFVRRVNVRQIGDTQMYAIEVRVLWKDKTKSKERSYSLKTLVEKHVV
ncbi:MAG: prepilin-type N-terminal cleavage/methylation domain-containing protein [Candidatus Cloacimonetes bacterium]|nr:prepilin-type N-terminal cleavage/methylation domain-containing protein [Candidatus Cloacimonadota bacterium]